MRIFINYKQGVEPDHSLARDVEERLRQEGHQVFRDESKLKAGDEWPARLEREVRDCQAMVSLLSNEALRSKWVLNEIDLAHRLGKRMFPFLIEEIEESLRFRALNPYFISTQWVRLCSDRDVDVDVVVSALAEPRHRCYRSLIDAKLAEYSIQDGREVLEALCGALWQAHWPSQVLGDATTHDNVLRLNGERAQSLTEALRNRTEVFASMSDQNASAYLKSGEPSIASRMAWQVQRLRCFADLVDSLVAKWNETCQSGRHQIEGAGLTASPVFDTSDGEAAFAPLDAESGRARFTPAPPGFVAVMHVPPSLSQSRQDIGAIRLCEYFDDGQRPSSVGES